MKVALEKDAPLEKTSQPEAPGHVSRTWPNTSLVCNQYASGNKQFPSTEGWQAQAWRGGRLTKHPPHPDIKDTTKTTAFHGERKK